MTILVSASGVSKTPRSSTGGVLEDDFSAENRGYHLDPTMALWPKVQPPWRPSTRTGLATLCVKPSLGLRNPTALKVGYHLPLAPALGFCSQNQEVRMRRLLPVPAVNPGVAQATQAQVVSVKAGDEVQADFLMQRSKTVEIAGHVVGRGGPANNAWVNLKLAGVDDYGFERQTRTDEKGRFELKGVPPGSYVIFVFQRDEENGPFEPHGQQKVEVSGVNIDSIVISVGRGTSLQGRVTVDGANSPRLERIAIDLSNVDVDEQLGAQGRAKKDGTFEIKSVSDGNYAVTVWGLESNWFVKSVRIGGDDILEKGLQLEKGSAGRTIEVVISSASAQLDGSVSDDDTPVAGAHVRVVPEPETPYNRFRVHSLRTDQTGRFSFVGLAPGTYRVLARHGGAAGSSALKSEPHVVTLSERDHKTMQLTMVKSETE